MCDALMVAQIVMLAEHHEQCIQIRKHISQWGHHRPVPPEIRHHQSKRDEQYPTAPFIVISCKQKSSIEESMYCSLLQGGMLGI